jgi:N-acetylneuraminic acid mutarotase
MTFRVVIQAAMCALAVPVLASQRGGASAIDRTSAPQRRTLSFEDRVAAQVAIDRVYFAHQIGTTKQFEQAEPVSIAAEKVRKYLEESAALERYWKTPVTEEMLRRELARMAGGSRMPDRLLEIYGALGNDSFLIEECVARATLVDRLTRNFYAFDPSLHAEARRRAEELHRQLASGALSPMARHPNRFEVELALGEPKPVGSGWLEHSDRRVDAGRAARYALDPEDYQKRRQELPARVGEVSSITEERDAFVVNAVLDETTHETRVARYVVPKTTWDSWWGAARRSLASAVAPVVASGNEPVPVPARRMAVAVGSGATGPSGAPCPGDDTWDNGVLNEVPDSRSGHTAVWTGTVMVIWGGERAGYLSPIGQTSGSRYDPATDSWSATSTVGAPGPRRNHTAIWTGREMVVWGGYDGYSGQPDQAGGRYDPVADSWMPTSTVGAPPGRYLHTAVWTGSRMVVWGGYVAGGSDTGGRYDPATDTWIATSTTGAPAGRAQHTAVWTGHVMLIWGGRGTSPDGVLGSGARYDPATDTWMSLSAEAPPEGRYGHTAIWTGTEMVIWGGLGVHGSLDTGGRYDPVADTWTATSIVGAATRRSQHSAIWTGHTMLVWGGRYQFDDRSYLDSGGNYDPLTDTWTATSNSGAPSARAEHAAVWTGRQMVVWGGADATGTIDTGGRYDPAADAWTPMSVVGRPSARGQHTAIWTGSVMVIWGGSFDATGSRYDPATDSWSPTSTVGAPTSGFGLYLDPDHTAVWAGSLMLIWSGVAVDEWNGRYDPVRDEWTRISTVDAPADRYEATAVWTGSRMILWGGFDAFARIWFNTGGIYDPETDTWTATSTLGAPSPRIFHTAVWTGSRMVVWGGRGDREDFDTGGRYDPATDTWAPTSVQGAPGAREHHLAVWTGHDVVVWGGAAAGGDTRTGGRYDPSADRWAPTSTSEAPEPRFGTSAVWTGKAMVVWGGFGDVSQLYLNTGARYDPIADTWAATSIVGAPSGRWVHTAIWTGRAMIVWGGRDSDRLASGGAYYLCASQPPVAAAGPDQDLQCQGPSGATAFLDGSASSDPDSTPGTNDDIVSYLWSDAGRALAAGITASVDLRLGVHDVTLTVTDKDGLTGTDDARITVQDTRPPTGAILSPAAQSCFGPAALPVTVTDDFRDVCDATVSRSYDPGPGPSYSSHGDYHVAMVAKDNSGNAATAAVDFTIDTKPPVVELLSPPNRALLVPSVLPFNVVFRDRDDDGAPGEALQEIVKLDGCTMFDGLTYGNRDGLLSDETLSVGQDELCRAAARCGFTSLSQPELRVEATDCGGNVGVASHHFAGSISLRPGICGP